MSAQVFRDRWKPRIESILDAIKGRGDFRGLIAGSIDLDNIDNLVRIAFHIGIPVIEDCRSNCQRYYGRFTG